MYKYGLICILSAFAFFGCAKNRGIGLLSNTQVNQYSIEAISNDANNITQHTDELKLKLKEYYHLTNIKNDLRELSLKERTIAKIVKAQSRYFRNQEELFFNLVLESLNIKNEIPEFNSDTPIANLIKRILGELQNTTILQDLYILNAVKAIDHSIKTKEIILNKNDLLDYSFIVAKFNEKLKNSKSSSKIILLSLITEFDSSKEKWNEFLTITEKFDFSKSNSPQLLNLFVNFINEKDFGELSMESYVNLLNYYSDIASEIEQNASSRKVELYLNALDKLCLLFQEKMSINLDLNLQEKIATEFYLNHFLKNIKNISDKKIIAKSLLLNSIYKRESCGAFNNNKSYAYDLSFTLCVHANESLSNNGVFDEKLKKANGIIIEIINGLK